MRAYHNSRNLEYRTPYGAATVGSAVSLYLDVWEAESAVCTLRLWIDGEGETLIPMSARPMEGFTRFSAEIRRETPAIVWYSFIIDHDGVRETYGARQGSRGGEGAQYGWEPPSFQITVYAPRRLPDWYRNGIVYQIFPDRFARDAHWRETLSAALAGQRNGPARRIEEDWEKLPVYEKDSAGRVTAWDFYGGTLKGIEEKLPYLKNLGVTALYLNPIFSAASNHRYDTADYLNVDAALGGNQAFQSLLTAAEGMGISVILDGVFNHTGCDSLYFDRYGNYGGRGAFGNPASEYRNWYSFDDATGKYDCWWGVDDLPNVNENNPTYRDFICGGRGSVIRKWMRSGVKGFRLDVADELPDDFIAGIKTALTEENPEGLLLGEVWEDASNKISYGQLRRYFLGSELDSVMNYPLRDALIDFLTGRAASWDVNEILESLRENYPPEALYGTLNMMGSHDRVRLMNLLGGAPDESSLSEAERCAYRLSPAERGLAKGRLWLITLVQMTMPGVPCIYYGDEAGMEGYSDPSNRAAFPWGHMDPDNGDIYRNAIALRRLLPLFTSGSFRMEESGSADVLMFRRTLDGDSALVMVNRSLHESRTVRFLRGAGEISELISRYTVAEDGGFCILTLPPMGSAVVYFKASGSLAEPLEPGRGVLCHVTSVPNGQRQGTLGQCARNFIDFLAENGQKYWQILPLTPADEYGSPYAGNSAFAGNPDLLDQSPEELQSAFSTMAESGEFLMFCRENAFWLEPWSLFMALKERYACPWWQFPTRYRSYVPGMEPEGVIAQRAACYRFVQFEFEREWQSVRSHARDRGIKIIGDMPMFVSHDSADVWAHRELFKLGPDGEVSGIAGVPPDYFAKEGQLWSNPVFNWDKIREQGFEWWIQRLKRAFSLTDYVRLDHFRGFEAFWETPNGEKATNGSWRTGPGSTLFEAAFSALGTLPVIAEDLGRITPGVRTLLAKCGFLGMDVLQFYDGDPLYGYVPPKNKIVYTGTHDNQTLLGWCADAYPEADSRESAEKLMNIALRCGAQVVILPLQDLAGLGDDARMNTPGTTDRNWKWQATAADLQSAAEQIARLGG